MLVSLAKSALRTIPARSFRSLAGLTVFYMHGLVRKHADERVQRLHLTVDEFRATMTALKRWVRFVSIDEALTLLATGGARAPLAVLTSDDGYVDNHDLLMPLTRELAIPLALFVSTRHIDTGERFPTYVTRSFAYGAPAGTYTLPGLEAPLEIADDDAARAAASAALGAAVYRLPQAGVRKLCAALGEALGADRRAELDATFASDQPMTWAQLKAMSDAGVEIGAHAHDHAILHRAQPRAEIEHQVLTSKTMIEERLGRCRYFAFPVGNVAHIGPQAVDVVRKAGFDAAFSTINGTLAASQERFLLPRVMLHRNSRTDEFNFPFTSLRHDRALALKQAEIVRPAPAA
jgi:peptidoglycan/xylan/chitin deacetylase (PgdA/CDA1 family)